MSIVRFALPSAMILTAGIAPGEITWREAATLDSHRGSVACVAFSPDGKSLVTASHDRTLKLWNSATAKEIATFRGHTNWVTSATFSPDGNMVASGSSDGTVRLWSVAHGKQVSLIKAHINELRTFSRGGRQLSRELQVETVFSVAFSPNGKLLASGGGDKTIAVCCVSTGEELLRLHGHTDIVTAVAFSPDGKVLASGGGDRSIRFWELNKGTELRKIQIDDQWNYGVSSICFLPDGKKICSAARIGEILGDCSLRLWDVATAKEILKLEGHESAPTSVAFSGDGKLLVSASFDSTVRLWDVTTGRQVRTLQGHREAVTSVAVSSDGATIASASEDGTVKLWARASNGRGKRGRE